ncbi:MAG: aromatic amino acid transport family protein [Patescibacteria group bacterium]|jgi:amino acid permease
MKIIHGHPDFAWWRTVGTMIGGVVGVGVFGLPYAFAQSGWWLGLTMLLVLGFLIMLLNFMYAEVVEQTAGRHRLVGYVKNYLGVWPANLMGVVFIVYAWGAMLAYILIGGDFLYTLLSPLLGGPLLAYQLVMAALSAILTFGGIKKLAKLETFIVGGLIFLFVFIILLSLPSIEPRNIMSIHWSGWFAPYGVLFFALSGLGVIPEMKDVLDARRRHELPHTILFGQVFIIALYALFTLAVVGVTGPATTPSAFDGLASMFGRTFAVAGSLLGSVAVLSIFSIVSIELQGILRFDYKINQKTAWLLTVIVPVVFLLLGVSQFIELISFLGAVFGGLIGIIVVIMYEKMRNAGLCPIHKCLNVPHFIAWLLVAVFIGGIIQTIFNF